MWLVPSSKSFLWAFTASIQTGASLLTASAGIGHRSVWTSWGNEKNRNSWRSTLCFFNSLAETLAPMSQGPLFTSLWFAQAQLSEVTLGKSKSVSQSQLRALAFNHSSLPVFFSFVIALNGHCLDLASRRLQRKEGWLFTMLMALCTGDYK